MLGAGSAQLLKLGVVLADESLQLLRLHVQAEALNPNAVELLVPVLLQVSLGEEDGPVSLVRLGKPVGCM
jgi:hypothetical protein